MAKGEPVHPGKGPNTSARAIGRAIISEWIDIITGSSTREMNPHTLGAAIRAQLVSGGAQPLEVGIITDPVHKEVDAQGNEVKFIWVCIPAPELLTSQWLVDSGYARRVGPDLVPDDTKSDDLGDAVLFGCGR